MRAITTVLFTVATLVTAVPVALSAGVLPISIDPSVSQWTISPYLVGLHQVYFNVPDAEFVDGRISAWAKRVGVSTSRYPGGGVVKTWDWENPSGFSGNDPYAPDYDPSQNVDESEWMSLDEYLDFVDESGIMPMFGVNSLSGTLYDREADSIARAVRMVQYVKDRGHGGALWYIGNEEAYQHGGMAEYAGVLARHAEAMKGVDSDIRIFWNQNNALEANIDEFLANDGGWIDGLETHGKWPFGGDPGLPVATFEEWVVEVPLRDRKNGTAAEIAAGGRAWREASNNYRSIATGAGRSILVANNEYGLGKSQYYSGFNRYTKGLALTEMLMEHFIGNWFSACLWDLENGTDRGVLDKANDYRFNPVHYGMNMLADCQGGEYLGTVATSIPSVHGFAARRDGIIFLYLLNKTSEAHPVEINFPSAGNFTGIGRRMQDSADRYGELVHIDLEESTSGFLSNLTSLTFTQFAFVDLNKGTYPALIDISQKADESFNFRWSSIPGARFELERSTNLQNWTPTGEFIYPDNTWTESCVPIDPQSNTFYRVLFWNE